MCLGKNTLWIVLFSFIFSVGNAAAAEDKPVAQSAAKKSRNGSKFGVGLGHTLFDEVVEVKDGSQSSKGYGNYAGIFVYADKSWTKKRWVYGAMAGVASGKVTGGGFGAVSYPDAGQRNWTMGFFDGYGLYRVQPRIMIGGGLLLAFRSADWKSSSNPQLKVKDKDKGIYAPELLLRWHLHPKFTLTQSLALTDMEGAIMWRWGGHYNF